MKTALSTARAPRQLGWARLLGRVAMMVLLTSAPSWAQDKPVPTADAQPPAWRALAAGVEYAAVKVDRPVPVGDGILHLLRVDGRKAELRAHFSSEPGEKARTAAGWCKSKGLLAAINLGMYQTDLRSSVGYARKGNHVNNGRINSYRSFLAFGPRRPGLPAVTMLDGEDADVSQRLAEYDVAIQNLRLIRGDAQNVWKQQSRRWTEAAVALDSEGRILFLFTRTPFSMWELNRLLLALPLKIAKAMHVEGGPEASLSIHAGGVNLDLNGSYETGFREDDTSREQWPLPNIIGVAAPR
jgi:hypothetical protein